VTDFNFPDSSSVVMAELVHALNDFRDALVGVSLVLQDYRFDLEGNQRQEAVALAHEWVLNAKFPPNNGEKVDVNV